MKTFADAFREVWRPIDPAGVRPLKDEVELYHREHSTSLEFKEFIRREARILVERLAMANDGAEAVSVASTMLHMAFIMGIRTQKETEKDTLQ